MYLSVISDRHTDPEYKLFEDAGAAKRYTRERFALVVAHPEYITDDTKSGDILELGYIESNSASVIKLDAACTCKPRNNAMVISADCPNHGYSGHH